MPNDQRVFLSHFGIIRIVSIVAARISPSGLRPAFSRVAESRDQFAELIDLPQNANSWLMIPLVDRCVELGMSRRPGQCYAFKVPPLLGGGCDASNVAPVDVVENYAFLADIWSQTKDLPDGTPVRLNICPRPESH